MSSWAFGVYQSDDSMDWESTIYEVAGIDEDGDDDKEFNRDDPAHRGTLEQGVPAILAAIDEVQRNNDETTGYQKSVGYQMLACILMRHGCVVPADTQQTIIAGILACPEYQLVKELLDKAGATEVTNDMVRPATLKDPFGPEGMRNRFNGRFSALTRLAKEFGEYDINAGQIYEYRDKGALELYGVTEEEAARHPGRYPV